jgi:hypothetical protein
MFVVFLAAFLGGLLLAVFAMLHGVERRAGFRVDLPTIAGFATVFGAVGYLLLRSTELSTVAVLAIAGGAGIVGAMAALLLVAAWAIPGAKAEVIDARYVLQGCLARVTAVRGEGSSEGTVEYTIDGITRTAQARALDGAHLDVGSDVAIERVEDGITYVEPWARIEARL